MGANDGTTSLIEVVPSWQRTDNGRAIPIVAAGRPNL
jgi:hypothetical protein